MRGCILLDECRSSSWSIAQECSVSCAKQTDTLDRKGTCEKMIDFNIIRYGFIKRVRSHGYYIVK